MEHFDVRLCFYVECFFHCTAVHEDWHIAIEDIDLLLCIRNHASGCPDAGDADYDAAYKEQATDNHHQFDFVFKILDYHSLFVICSIRVLY